MLWFIIFKIREIEGIGKERMEKDDKKGGKGEIENVYDIVFKYVF